MKIRFFIIAALFIFAVQNIYAQETTLSIKEAVNIALTNSDKAQISKARVNTAENELSVTKNNKYPDVKISGQYSYLTNADVNFKLPTGSSDSQNSEDNNTEAPNINQLLLGQATISMPIFSGFKLKNSIKASQNNLNAVQLDAQNSEEQIALQTIQDYINLYKARKTVALIDESRKSTKQRVKDFEAMEQNGLLARNDLLKAQLQESNVELSLEEARKNATILNYKLATDLKLPENTKITIPESVFEIEISPMLETQIQRSDLEALRFKEKAAKNAVEVEKGNYFPSLAITGGYIALDVENALTVNNAMNIGLGVSYNLASIFKNKSEVKLAKNKALELEHSINMVSNKIKVQVKNAQQEYQLALTKFNVYTKSEEQAIENYRIVKDKYDNGLIDTNDLLEADVEQLQAKMNLTYSKAAITEKYYELLRAEGKLTNEFKKQ